MDARLGTRRTADGKLTAVMFYHPEKGAVYFTPTLTNIKRVCGALEAWFTKQGRLSEAHTIIRRFRESL